MKLGDFIITSDLASETLTGGAPRYIQQKSCHVMAYPWMLGLEHIPCRGSFAPWGAMNQARLIQPY